VKSNPLPRAFVLGAASLSVVLGLSACGASNEDTTTDSSSTANPVSGDLNGAGSSAQESAMTAWKAGFQTANPDATVNYDAVGSSGGREQFIAGGVLFAGSDSYLSDEELTAAADQCGGPAIEFPVYVSPIAVIYNLPGVDDLQLSPETLAKIFAGDITTWDDDAIAADNPDADLPSTTVSPVHRSDGSGTTANFTDYLDQVDSTDWTYGPTDEWPIKSGEGAEGTSGVVAAVTKGEGTIGYADESQAGDLGQALIEVGAEYVAASADAASKILDESTPVEGRDEATDLALVVNRTSDTAGVYPIILISYQMVCSTYGDQDTVDLVKAFASYVISADGQDTAAGQAGSAPITDALRTKAQAAIDTIAVK
jgi:phosphate transport system substrate-binding protein